MSCVFLPCSTNNTDYNIATGNTIENNIRNHPNAWHLVGGKLNCECKKNNIGNNMLSDILV